MLARLARLRAELDVDLWALDARDAEVREILARWGEAGLFRAELVLVAVNLHGWYTALETLLERIARLLDDAVPEGPTWHADLLGQAAVELPTLRPAAIPTAALQDLHSLRRFRHFFRNAYVLDLDHALVRAQADILARSHPSVRAREGSRSRVGFANDRPCESTRYLLYEIALALEPPTVVVR